MLRPVRPALALLALAALAAVLALPSCGDGGGGACLGPACGDPGPVVGEYEYVVVGSGAGGGPLASRLARAGHRVLLVEAGQDVGGKLNYRVPARHARATEDPDMAWWYFVRHHDDPTLDAADSKATPEGVLYPRGSALGGSTAVNAMVTVLPARSDWDHLAALTGDPRFRASAMDETVDKVLSWLSVDVPSPALAADDEVVTAMLTAAAAADAQDGADGTDLPALAGELARLLARDLNQTLRAGETTGLYRLPLATRDGERSGPRDLIVDTVAQGYPLTVLTGALVTRVLFDPAEPVPTAIGVELVREEHVYGASLAPAAPSGARQCAFASREVVLSAGTFNTPQLLMLSG
ncbi:MAG: GMC family oxidoreductase, partial [Myxococcales bacterium]|nr:GMC family oxidoreductase [Myxococcales bacterium]